MSERERWIIYPLLFLAISATLKDKIVTPMSIKVNRLEAKQIVTGQITSSRAKFEETSTNVVFANRISIIDKRNQPKVTLQAIELKTEEGSKASAQGHISVIGSNGKPSVALGVGSRGGFVATSSEGVDSQYVLVGHSNAGPGVHWRDNDGNDQSLTMDADGLNLQNLISEENNAENQNWQDLGDDGAQQDLPLPGDR